MRRTSVCSGLAVLAAAVCAAVLAVRAVAPTQLRAGDIPASEFSARRAFALLQDIAAEPHALGTASHDAVRDKIIGMWRDLGLEPQMQAGLYASAEKHYIARVENILVRLPGKNPPAGRALMLATHYDSVAPAPGAADAGSGVVTLLETARALLSGPPLAGDVIFLITDAEEDGLIGAHVFMDEHPWAKEVGLALNFEARGTTGASLMFESSRGNGKLIQALASAPHPRAYSFGGMVYRSMPNSSDLSVWMEGGIQGMNFAFIGRPYDYHTAGDNLSHLNLRSLQHHGSYALALARRFGNGGISERTAGDSVYFSLFGDLLVRYSRGLALGLAGLMAALFAAAGVVGAARRKLKIGGVLRGLMFEIGALGLSAGLGYGFLAAVRASHRSWLPPGPWRYNTSYLLALVFLALAATSFLFSFIKAKKRAFEMIYGAAAVWVVLSVLAALKFSEASYLIVWPALFLGAALLIWAWRRNPKDEEDPAPDPWSAGLAAIPPLLIAAPVILLFFLAMFLSPLFAVILAGITALMTTAMLPAFEVMRRGLRGFLPPICLALFVGFAVAGALTATYNDRIPRPAVISYLQDFDKNQAYWVTPTRPPDPWAEQVAGGKLKPGHPQTEYAGRPEMYSTAEAPLSSLAPPEVNVIEEGTSGDSRSLRLRIVSPRGGRQMVVTCVAEKLASAAVEGRPIDLASWNAAGFGMVFMNPGREGFEMTLKAAAGTSIRLILHESNPGLPALAGFVLPPVPSGIRPHRNETVLSKTYDFPPLSAERSR